MASKGQVSTAGFFATHPVFSLAEAVSALGPRRGAPATVNRLKHHLKSGRLKRLARELYAVVPVGEEPREFQPDPFLVAQALRADAVFCFHSALELLGVAHSAWNECTVYSASRRPALKLGFGRIQCLDHPSAMRQSHDPLLGTQRIERLGQLLRATGAERTLVEGFRRQDLAGGLAELTTSAAGFVTLDLALLERVLKTYDARQLWGAVGWFLERYQSTFHVPVDYLERLEARRPRSPQYVPGRQRGGVLVARWNVILPSEIVRIEPDEHQSEIS